MQPHEFNDRLHELVEEARKGGLAVAHVRNGIDRELQMIPDGDEWTGRFELVAEVKRL